MTNNEKIKVNVAKVNELFNNFYIKHTYFFEGECDDDNCLEFNEEDCRIYAEIGLPYALGYFIGNYDNLADFVDELVKRIEFINVKQIAKEKVFVDEVKDYLYHYENKTESVHFIRECRKVMPCIKLHS